MKSSRGTVVSTSVGPEIEATIRFALFERAGGKQQVDRMEVRLNLINCFVNDLREQTGRLSIVVMPLMLDRQVPELVSGFLGDHPGVDVTLQSHNMPRMFHSVAIGEVDVAIDITGREHEDVQLEPLIELELACVVPRNHRLAHHAICPSSNDLRRFGLWKNGVSGSVCGLI